MDATNRRVRSESGLTRVIVLFARLFWQLAVIVSVLFQVGTQPDWSRAMLAVGASIFIATDVLLSTHIDDARWPRVRLWVVHAETLTATVIALLMIHLVPLAPASLLLLPTLTTYAWLNRNSTHQYEVWTGILAVAMYIGQLKYVLSFRDSSHSMPLVVSVFGLYAVIIGFSVSQAWMLRRQWRERQQSDELVHKLQRQSEQLVRVNEQVNAYANRVYDLATAEERNRIAGEIHDTVAHRLTALLVQLQGARRMVENGDEAAATENMRVSEELARESLDEVRKSVRAIRRHSGDEGIKALQRLTLHYASLTGMSIHFEAAEDVHAIPAQLMAMLYRVIQEGLTNAQRHGRATQVKIRLMRSASMLILNIADNGMGAAEAQLGFGLSSMRNRLRQYGGDIFVESQPGTGFVLELNVPLWEGVTT